MGWAERSKVLGPAYLGGLVQAGDRPLGWLASLYY